MFLFCQHQWGHFRVSPRFCLSNVISYGQTFLDLVLHCAGYIRTNMKVSYNPPHADWRKFASRVVQISLSKRLQKDSDQSNTRQKLDKLIRKFLTLFNGNWKDWSPQGLQHHCHVQCECGGLRPHDVAEAAATTFVELVMFSRPPIPALSRWLKCSETAKWYLSLAFFVTLSS